MKKTLVMMSAIALAMFGFSSCEKPAGPDVENIIEDGFYVTGPATGLETLDSKAMMSIAGNENDGNKKVEGMFEKYIVLDADKEFVITNYSAGAETYVGAKLAKKNVNGKDDQIKNDFFTGKADASLKMKVKEAGLYHVIYYKPLNDIYVIPVTWGVRGVNGDWGWTAMKASEVNHDKMTWTIEYKDKEINAGDFKFAHSDGWKLEVDPAKKIKVNTNLGANMEPGGKNIDLLPYKKGSKIILTYNFVKGSVAKAYSWKIDGEKTVLDPATLVVGLSGTAFPNQAKDWIDPDKNLKATYNAAESKITDKDQMIGTLVYNMKDVEFLNGKEFKFRFNGAWLGAGSGVKVKGLKVTGSDNFTTGEAGKFNIKITVTWKFGLCKGATLEFSK